MPSETSFNGIIIRYCSVIWQSGECLSLCSSSTLNQTRRSTGGTTSDDTCSEPKREGHTRASNVCLPPPSPNYDIAAMAHHPKPQETEARTTRVACTFGCSMIPARPNLIVGDRTPCVLTTSSSAAQSGTVASSDRRECFPAFKPSCDAGTPRDSVDYPGLELLCLEARGSRARNQLVVGLPSPIDVSNRWVAKSYCTSGI